MSRSSSSSLRKDRTATSAATLARALLCALALGTEPGNGNATPSPAEPAVDGVSRASPAPEDAGRPVAAIGSFDGARARARNRKRLAEDRSAVVLLTGDSVLSLGQRLCEQVVPRRPPETPVLIKPNLGGFDWFKRVHKPGDDDGLTGRITQPAFVRGVIRCLKARGHTRIAIADGWDSPHAAWKRLVRLSGYEALAKEEGVQLYALDDDGVFDVEGEQPAKPTAITGLDNTRVPTLLMPRALARHLESGLVIAVPKLKAHRFAVTSIAIKGLQGSVMMSDGSPAHRQKFRMHREINGYLRARKQGLPETPAERAAYVAALQIFAERLSDVLEIEAPDAVLVDAAPAMGGDGFQKLFPQSGLYALGGTNPVLVDRIGAELLGLWDNAALAQQLGGHRTSPILTTAAARFGVDIRAPVVSGDGAPRLRDKSPGRYIAMAPFALAPPAGGDAPVAPPSAPVAPPSVPVAPPSVPVAPLRPLGPGGPAEAPPLPVFHAVPAGDKPPVLDGRSDDPAWSRAPRVRFDTDYAGRATGVFTTARFLYGKGVLYALFELESADLFVDPAFPIGEERKDLYQEDCVELMMGPRPDEPWRFYEMELGPRGHFFDLAIDRKAKRPERPEWSSGARIATTQDPAARRATIEVAFSAPELAALIAPGATVLAGIFRMDGRKPRRYLSWRPTRTPGPNFHIPEAFGLMHFAP